jgi:NitT/TauT family transport system substrate-binding protein
MRAWLRGVRAYNDAIKDGKIAGPGADEIVQTISKSFSMNPTLVREMYSQAVHVDGAVNAEGIQKDLDFFLKQGWVTGQVKASDVIDPSFAKKASAALGPYQRKPQ